MYPKIIMTKWCKTVYLEDHTKFKNNSPSATKLGSKKDDYTDSAHMKPFQNRIAVFDDMQCIFGIMVGEFNRRIKM